MATHFSVLAWRIPWTVQHGVTKSQTQLSDFQNQLPVGSSKDKGTARKKIILTITTIYVQHLKYIKHFENHISLNPHQTFCFLHHLDEDIEAQREHCSVHIFILQFWVYTIDYVLSSLYHIHGVSRSVMSNSLQPHGLQLARLLYPWNSPGKNTRVSSHSLLQGIFPTQGSNLCLLNCRQILHH